MMTVWGPLLWSRISDAYDLKSFRGSGGSVGSCQQRAAYPMTFRMDENAIALTGYGSNANLADGYDILSILEEL